MGKPDITSAKIRNDTRVYTLSDPKFTIGEFWHMCIYLYNQYLYWGIEYIHYFRQVIHDIFPSIPHKTTSILILATIHYFFVVQDLHIVTCCSIMLQSRMDNICHGSPTRLGCHLRLCKTFAQGWTCPWIHFLWCIPAVKWQETMELCMDFWGSSFFLCRTLQFIYVSE
jgi:hypothetical protein